MKLLASVEPKLIIIIVVAVVIVAVAAAVLLSMFVFSRNRIAKEVKAIDKKFSHLHALVISQCASQIRRLEIISRTNLTYIDKHSNFLKQFKDVRDRLDSKAQTATNNIKDLLADKKFKELKAQLPETKTVVDEYEVEVNRLNSALLAELKPEDDARQNALGLQESYRRLKQDYELHKNELSLVSDSYEKIFESIDDKFRKFEDRIESANYDEANEILPKISAMLHGLTKAQQELPDLVAQVNTLIPDKIHDLETRYSTMTDDGYPLNHLTVKVNIQNMNEKLDVLRGRIRLFDTKGVADQLNQISATIDEFFKLFDDEKKARAEFESDNTDIYKSVNDIEKRFIKLKNRIPEVSKIFIINNEHNAKINEIQNEINKVGAFKRSLDTLVHSSTKQPYSTLNEKMKALHEESDLVINDIQDFMNYLESLKTDSQNAYATIREYFVLLKNAEKELRDINNDEVAGKYQPTINHIYDLLAQVNDLLKVQPIDVEKVNENIKAIHEEGDQFLGDNGEIVKEAKMKVLAEHAIIYANRSRNRLADVDASIKQSEALFRKGKYEDSYQIASSVLKRIKAMTEEN